MSQTQANEKRIAIMGGTFDPIHMGHLVTAEAVRHEFHIDEVIFIPTGNPPHKSNICISSTEHRYLMAVLATAANEHFHVSRVEIDRKGTTYAIDTIKEIKNLYGKNTELYFITGADAVQEILTWKNPADLLKLCTFIAVTRPGYHKEELMAKVEELRNQFDSSIQFLEVPALSISSSDIRERVKAKRPIKYLVTSAVENYIYKQKLYMSNSLTEREQIKQFMDEVKRSLSDERYIHTLGVIERAIELGTIHGIDTDKLFLAALFHDVAKELSDAEIIRLCQHYHLNIDPFEKEHLNIVHGKVAAALLEDKWGIKDQDILNSIRYHTIGRENMSAMEEIIYLADMTERGRKPFPSLEKIRCLSEINLKQAMYEALISSKEYVTKVLKKEMHPISDRLIEIYKSNR